MSPNKVENIKVAALSSAVPNNSIVTNGEKIAFSLPTQTASDLAFEAAQNILKETSINLEEVGVLIFLTTTPDYRSPATAMVLQKRLQIGKDCIVYDINSGGSGFVYGLQVGSSLLKTISKKYALVLLGDTPSKQFEDTERNKLGLSDAGSAVLLEKDMSEGIWEFLNLTISQDFEKYILKSGGYRGSKSQGDSEPYTGLSTLTPLEIKDGFVVEKQEELIPRLLTKYCAISGSKENDFILFSHYNQKSFKSIQQKLELKAQKTATLPKIFGVPLGSQLPLLIEECIHRTEMNEKNLNLVLVSFGEGLSVSLAKIKLDASKVLKVTRTDNYYSEGSVTHEI